MPARRRARMLELRPAQRKAVIRRLPQTQPNEPMPYPIVNLRPKRPHDVFTCGRRVLKILCFEIEMAISPRLKRFRNRVLQRHKIVERAAASVVFAADCRFSQIAVSMAARIIALAVKLRVIWLGKCGCMQSMRRMERHLQSEENGLIRPRFGKKIIALM